MLTNSKKDILIFLLFIILIFFFAHFKGVFTTNWWINFDMDVIIASNSISILNNNRQSYFDHPGLTPIVFFSFFLRIVEFLNFLNFEIINYYDPINFLKNISDLIHQIKIFNILCISILMFTFFKIFEIFFKNKIYSILLTSALFINYNFLALNFFPVRTEVLSLLFLNLIFIFSINYNINKTLMLLLGVFFALSLFSKIQIILICIIYSLIFMEEDIFFNLKEKVKIYFKYFFLINIIISMTIYFFSYQLLDSFVFFLIFSIFNFYFISINTHRNSYLSNIYFFYGGFLFIIIIIFFNYDIKNIEVAFNPIKNSLRWSQEQYALNNLFKLESFNQFDVIDMLKNYKNFIIIIFLNLILLIRNNQSLRKKFNNLLILFLILIVWIVFSQRSGLLRYGIYILPCFYILIAKLISNNWSQFNLRTLLTLLVLNVFINFSFLTKHYEFKDNYLNIKRINELCNISSIPKKFNNLNYFFSMQKTEIKIICTNIRNKF